MTMDEKTKEALESSIKHWEQLSTVDNEQDIVLGARACALCKMFLLNVAEEENDCLECPLYLKTNKVLCDFHTYHSAYNAYILLSNESTDFTEFHKAANEMLELLKSLREE